MQFLGNARYVSVVQKNDTCTIYYDMNQNCFVEYVSKGSWKPSLKYYIGIPSLLYGGRVLDMYLGRYLFETFIIQLIMFAISLIISFVVLVIVGEKIVVEISNRGRPIFGELAVMETVRTGRQQLKKQMILIICFSGFCFVLILIYFISNSVLLWILYTLGLSCLGAMIIVVNPISRNRLYHKLEEFKLKD